jgi:hypothetical protein
MEPLSQIIIPAIVGGLAGAISAWSQWGIEKRRQRLQRRQSYVDDWRRELLDDWDPTLTLGGNGPNYAFMKKPAYASIRDHLSQDFRATLETKRTIRAGGGDFPRRELIAEIARIEREWGLV